MLTTNQLPEPELYVVDPFGMPFIFITGGLCEGPHDDIPTADMMREADPDVSDDVVRAVERMRTTVMRKVYAVLPPNSVGYRAMRALADMIALAPDLMAKSQRLADAVEIVQNDLRLALGQDDPAVTNHAARGAVIKLTAALSEFTEPDREIVVKMDS